MLGLILASALLAFTALVLPRCGDGRATRLVGLPLDVALASLDTPPSDETASSTYYAPGWHIVGGPPATGFRGLAGPLLEARETNDGLTEVNYPPPLAFPPYGYLGYFPKGGDPIFPPPIRWCAQWIEAPAGKPFLIGNPSASIPAVVTGAASVEALDPRTGRLYPVEQIPPGYGARVVADERGMVVVDAGACDHAAPTARGVPAPTDARPYSIWLWLDRAVCDGGPVTLTVAVLARDGTAIPGVTVRAAVEPEMTRQYGTLPYPTAFPLELPPTDDIGRTQLTIDPALLGLGESGYRLRWMVRAESNIDNLDRAPATGTRCELHRR